VNFIAKLSKYLPVVCAALLALATWWLADQVRRNSEPAAPSSATRPDFVVEGVRMSRLGETGQVQSLISAVKLTHIPENDTAKLDHPQVIYTKDASPPVTMTADAGISHNANETVDLTGNVRVVRAADAKGPVMHLETEQLRVRPDDDTASSDVFVHIDRSDSIIEGVGMDFSNAFRRLEIRQRASGQLAAAAVTQEQK
jgi:lipopolysaccharide export system protein LptC